MTATPKTFLCPRRSEVPSVFKLPEHDHLMADSTCSYCGSLDGDVFMERLEADTIRLEGSDKNYKTYVQAVEGSPPLLQTYREMDAPPGVWTTREISQQKFYFMHLTAEQKQRFVELWNEGRAGGLYVLPYFMQVKK